MPGTDDVRRLVLALPETAEGTHFRMPSFQVSGKNFIGVRKDGSVTLAMGAALVPGIVAADPSAITEVRREKPIGIGIDLTRSPGVA